MGDLIQRLHLEPVGQRQFVEFAGDRLGFEWRHASGDHKIDVRLRGMRALGAGSKQDRRTDPRMPRQNAADERQFTIREMRAVQQAIRW